MSILHRIVTRVRERLDETRREVPVAEMRAIAESAPRPVSFREALTAPGTTLVAEAKRASPSKGVLREPYDPMALACEYVAGGASTL